MNSQFNNQVAVITGAASGLGFAIANKLHQEGAKIALLDLNEEPVRSAAKKVGENAFAFPVDVTNEEQVKSVVERTAGQFGRIDVLVNSAGVTGKTNIKSHEVELSDFRFVFEVNVVGSFLTARAVLPVMLKQNYGR